MNHTKLTKTSDSKSTVRLSLLTLKDEKISRKQARFNELSEAHQLKVLHTEIAKIYIGLKQKTRDSQEGQSVTSIKSGVSHKRLDSRNEREIIMQLDFFVLIEYIKSAIDIILQLKFDEIE